MLLAILYYLVLLVLHPAPAAQLTQRCALPLEPIGRLTAAVPHLCCTHVCERARVRARARHGACVCRVCVRVRAEMCMQACCGAGTAARTPSSIGLDTQLATTKLATDRKCKAKRSVINTAQHSFMPLPSPSKRRATLDYRCYRRRAAMSNARGRASTQAGGRASAGWRRWDVTIGQCAAVDRWLQ